MAQKAQTERATVIAELIASLDGEPDADAEQAWPSRSRAGPGREWSSIRADLDALHRTK